MNCKEFNNQLPFFKNIDHLPTNMLQHMSQCDACRETFVKAEVLMAFIAGEKSAKVPSFITTRIMTEIEKPANKPWFVKPALISVLSGALLVLGFLSAAFFSNLTSIGQDSTEVIASEYYFSNQPASQLEEIWLNSYQYE